MLLAAICATPAPTRRTFAQRLDNVHVRLEIVIAQAKLARLERELDTLQRQIAARPISID
jgi:hypothetical protein